MLRRPAARAAHEGHRRRGHCARQQRRRRGGCGRGPVRGGSRGRHGRAGPARALQRRRARARRQGRAGRRRPVADGRRFRTGSGAPGVGVRAAGGRAAAAARRRAAPAATLRAGAAVRLRGRRRGECARGARVRSVRVPAPPVVVAAGRGGAVAAGVCARRAAGRAGAVAAHDAQLGARGRGAGGGFVPAGRAGAGAVGDGHRGQRCGHELGRLLVWGDAGVSRERRAGGAVAVRSEIRGERDFARYAQGCVRAWVQRVRAVVV